MCEADEDCPIVTIAGQPTQLLCDHDSGGGHPAAAGECYHPNLELSNDNLEAYFGESYEPYRLGHPGVTIPIRYCHLSPGYVAAPNDYDDFAYCILAEEPDIQPIPIMMHCEVDRYLTGDLDLQVMIAGFGIGALQETQASKAGRKRWAVASTATKSFSSADTFLSFALFSDFLPGGALSGDSGGPLLVRLPHPHNTWRVLGVLIKPTFATPPWQFVEWMLEDPEVEAAKILPCHEPDGSWSPGPGCGSFPLSPTLAPVAGPSGRRPVTAKRSAQRSARHVLQSAARVPSHHRIPISPRRRRRRRILSPTATSHGGVRRLAIPRPSACSRWCCSAWLRGGAVWPACSR